MATLINRVHESEFTESSDATPEPSAQPSSQPSLVPRPYSQPTSEPRPAAEPESEEFQGPDSIEVMGVSINSLIVAIEFTIL